MIAPASVDASILSRLIAPERPTLTPEAAKGILALAFCEQDRQRMSHLAHKARQGALTDDERAELDSYERIGSLLGLLQSKARLSLKQAAAGNGPFAIACGSGP